MSRPPRGPRGTGRRTRAVLALVLAGLVLGPAALASTWDAGAGAQTPGIESASTVLADQLDASVVPGGTVVVWAGVLLRARRATEPTGSIIERTPHHVSA